MSVVVVISQNLLNVFVQLANKRALKKTLGIIANIPALPHTPSCRGT
jgi:hypothetical protein